MLNIAAPHERNSRPLPFFAGEVGRPLRVVLDSTSINPSSALDLLRQFRHRPALEVLETGDGAINKLAFGDLDDQRDIIPVEMNGKMGARMTGIGSASSWVEHARVSSQEFGLSEEDCRAGLLLAQWCARNDVDALVTGREILRTTHWKALAHHASRATAEGALALAGLRLRAEGDFTITAHPGGGATYTTSDEFYEGAALGHLDSFEQWHDRALSAWIQGAARPFSLVRALPVRLGRAIRARDFSVVRSQPPMSDERLRERLFFFEHCVVALDGALDVLARLLAEILQVKKNLRPSWRSEAFLVEVESAASETCVTLRRDGPFVDTARLIGVVRNHIHEAPLGPDHVRSAGAAEMRSYGPSQIVLADATDIGTVSAVGGRIDQARWGITGSSDEVVTVDPLRFADAAISAALLAIDEVLGCLGLERLPVDSDVTPSSGFGDKTWHARAAALVGIGDLPAPPLD